jgi:two-component system, LytTR family, sensor histidine kinase AlgZ
MVFDACRVGVVLRVVLFVQSVLAVGALFGALTPAGWLARFALLTGAGLPAAALWLVVGCSAKRITSRWPMGWQRVWALGLGALAGVYACAVLALTGLLSDDWPAPWLASGAAGILMAGLVLSVLELRAKGRTPADTAARLAELQSRIRPHFLFNTLNSAIALVRAEPAKAEALLEDLSDLFRHALSTSSEPVSLAQELAMARQYLAIESVRFGPRLQLTWALDSEASAARVPPLLLQPLVENAVVHGVEPSADGAEVHVSTQRRGQRVIIKVSNTVPAGPGRRGHGLAQDNVRQRLALLYDLDMRFQCGQKNGVYQVRIEVPA